MYNGVIFNSKYVLSLSYKTFQRVLYIKLVLLLEKKKKGKERKKSPNLFKENYSYK